MTIQDKRDFMRMQISPNEASDAECNLFLTMAENKILHKLYPFGIPDGANIPSMYEVDQCELAARLYNRKGVEGQTYDTEGDIHRHYGSVDDEDILNRIVPFAKVVG